MGLVTGRKRGDMQERVTCSVSALLLTLSRIVLQVARCLPSLVSAKRCGILLSGLACVALKPDFNFAADVYRDVAARGWQPDHSARNAPAADSAPFLAAESWLG